MPFSTRKIMRLNPRSYRGLIFGMNISNIFSALKSKFTYNPPTSLRVYELPGENRFFVKTFVPDGSQQVFEVIKSNNGVEFLSAGSFRGFFIRQVFDGFGGKGIGTAALRSFLAMKRKKGVKNLTLCSMKKSTLRFLFKNGFELDEGESAKTLSLLGLRGKDDLKEYLKKGTMPEDLLDYIFLHKSLRIESKKEK